MTFCRDSNPKVQSIRFHLILSLLLAAGFIASCSHPKKPKSEVSKEKPVAQPQASQTPYAPSTSIPYFTKDTCHVTLVLYDVAGQMIDTLVNQIQPPGDHQSTFASDYFIAMVGGVYFYQVDACGDTATKKVVILK
jgi:hypothetical protein